MKRIIGYTPDEMLGGNFSYEDLIHPTQSHLIKSEALFNIRNFIDRFEQPYQFKTKSGTYLWLSDFTMLIRDEGGRLHCMRSYLRDQSEQKNTEEALRLAEARLNQTAYDLTENIPVGTYTMVQPPDGGMAHFSFMSSRFLELTGLNRAEAKSDPIKAFSCVHPDDFDDWIQLNVKAFETQQPFFGETRVIVKGNIRWITAESTPRRLPDGTTVWEGVLTDVTDRHHAKAELQRKTEMLEKLSLEDGLTQIPNRRQFDDRAILEWQRAQRTHEPLSIVMMDIDHFKEFNDHYGHNEGDECLRQVAKALAKVCNRSADLVARYGGEEFVALLPETDLAGALRVAEQLRAAVEHLAIPHHFSSVARVVTLSAGVATQRSNNVHATFQSLKKAADTAMYKAKHEGRNQVRA